MRIIKYVYFGKGRIRLWFNKKTHYIPESFAWTQKVYQCLHRSALWGLFQELPLPDLSLFEVTAKSKHIKKLISIVSLLNDLIRPRSRLQYGSNFIPYVLSTQIHGAIFWTLISIHIFFPAAVHWENKTTHSCTSQKAKIHFFN